MTAYSKDYHDYVFRDGQLVGKFEEMYRYSEAVPWHQDQQHDWIDVRLTVDLLKDLGTFEEIHDLGAGLGHYLALMRSHVGDKNCRGYGYDVSETACAKARMAFPELQFEVLDLMRESSYQLSKSRAGTVARRLFIIRGTLWYVYPKLKNVVKNIRSMMDERDKLLVVQNFPSLDSAFVGKEVIPDHTALIEHFSKLFIPLRHLWYEEKVKTDNDNWFVGLFTVRKFE